MARKSLIFILSFVFAVVASSITHAQGLSDAELEQKLSLTLDSIKTYGENNDMQKVQIICNNGIMLLQNNDLYATKITSLLEFYAGNACLSLKDYVGAKMYFKNSFMIDEYAGYGMDIYSSIKKSCHEESQMHYFMRLIDMVKSDSLTLKLLVKEPKQLANNLNSIALKHFDKGEYVSSIDHFEMELDLLESINEIGSPDYLSILPIIIRNLERLKRYDDAISVANNLIYLTKYYIGVNSLEYAHALQEKAEAEYTFGRGAESVILYNEALFLIEKIKGKENMTYLNCLRNAALAYEKRDNNQIKKTELHEEYSSLINKAKDATFEDKAECYFMLSSSSCQIGNWIKALEYARKTVDTYEKTRKLNTCDYAQYLSNLSSVLTKNSSFDEAISVGKKAIEVYNGANRTILDNIRYRLAVGDLSQTYYDKGDIQSAISLIKTVLTPETPDDEYKLIHQQRLCNFYKGNKELAQACQDQLALAEKIAGRESPEYAQALMFASIVQDKTGDKIMMLKKAADIYKNCYGEKSESYIHVLQALAFTQRNTQNQEVNIENGTSMTEKLKSLYGDQSRAYFKAYLNQYLLNNGTSTNITESILELQTVLSQIKNKFGEKDNLYLSCKNYIARANENAYEMTREKKYMDCAIETQKDVVKRSKEKYGEQNLEYISSIGELAYIESQYNDPNFKWENKEGSLFLYFNEVDSLQQIVCDYYKNEFGIDNEEYADAVRTLGQYYHSWLYHNPVLLGISTSMFGFKDSILGTDIKEEPVYKNLLYPRIQKTINLLDTALEIYKKHDNKERIASTLKDFYFIYYLNEEKEKASSYMKQSFDLWKNSTLSEFSMLTSDEKSHAVNSSDYKLNLDLYTMNALSPRKCNAEYAEIAYDTQLLNKGMLLSSEIGLRELIRESGDAESKSLLDRLIQIKSDISKNGIDENDKKRLQKKYETTERTLMKRSQQFGDYMRGLSVSLNDVRKSLKANDAAIEFAIYRTLDYSIGSTREYTNEYYALVLKNGYTSPKVVRLCLEKKLKNNDSLYYNVWKPLEEELKDVDNVYFSPILKLNNLPLESAKLPDGSIISDHGKRFLRLSSTRELVKANSPRNYKSAVLYGGLQYDASVNDMVSSDKTERTNGLRGTSAEDEELESDLRSGFKNWNFLTGTKLEMDEICKITAANNIVTKPYTGTQGTESTFKNLSGKKKDFIHIATHGFYIRPKNNQSELEAMERSGLVFAGANNINKGIQLPEGVDNGLLTAAEVARMDLRKVDMVVMSACQTGLGDNTTSEGVYGLQRGFKKAGVNSLVMSLWSVPDPPTQMLMTEFYKNLFKGLSKYDSLEKAKTSVRTYDNGQYAAPVNWAGFILLDGLN